MLIIVIIIIIITATMLIIVIIIVFNIQITVKKDSSNTSRDIHTLVYVQTLIIDEK
ncbi:unnamed protein product [Schistosoma curassoni]|uniref:Uncharacterized protein n=1 Tax=Schistosoma curassoni TaxID=6186 RepID=A0A183JCZ4_9TREM|nr:unnamed protein product [Schistosoma curassoni]